MKPADKGPPFLYKAFSSLFQTFVLAFAHFILDLHASSFSSQKSHLILRLPLKVCIQEHSVSPYTTCREMTMNITWAVRPRATVHTRELVHNVRKLLTFSTGSNDDLSLPKGMTHLPHIECLTKLTMY